MTKYFININDLQELRKQYRDLLKKHHPDNGGNEDIMKAVNAEYDKLFKILKDRHESNSSYSTSNSGSTDDSDNTNDSSTKQSAYDKNMYDWENDKAIREALEKIINFDGIEIEIAGQWIWVSGNTYCHRKELKEAGYRYASKKKQWYFHTEAFRKKSRKALTMEDIRNYYGSTKVNINSKVLLEA